MNDLSYQLITDSVTKRYVNLVSVLLDAPTPVFLSVILSNSGISKKTLQKDIEYLNENTELTIQYSTVGATSIELISDNQISLEFINTELTSSPLFMMIETLFLNQNESISTMSDRLFIAESTLRKYLNQLKIVLKDYRLTLQLSPVSIQGNEVDCRYFFFQYYNQPKSREYVQVDKKVVEVVQSIIEVFSNDHNVILNLDFHRLVTWLTIIKMRVSKKQLVSFSDEILEKYSKDHTFLKLQEILNEELKDPILRNLPKDELVFIYLLLFDAVIYGKDNYFFVNDFMSQVETFNELVTSFFKESKLDFGYYIELRALLQAFLANQKALSQLSPLFEKADPHLKKVVKERHPQMLALWCKLMKVDPRFTFYEDVAVSLTVLTENNSLKKKIILLALSGSPTVTMYYRERIKRQIPRDMELVYLSNLPIDNALIKKLSVDLCICNFPLMEKITGCPFFALSESPSQKELDALLLRIYRLT